MLETVNKVLLTHRYWHRTECSYCDNVATRKSLNLDQALRWIAAEYFRPLGPKFRGKRLSCWAIVMARMSTKDRQLQASRSSQPMRAEELRSGFRVGESTLSRSIGTALSNIKEWTPEQQDLSIRRYNVPDTDYLNTGNMSRFSELKYVPSVQDRIRVYSQCAILLAIIARARQDHPLDVGLLADRKTPNVILGGGWRCVVKAVKELALSKSPLIQYLMTDVKPFARKLQQIPDIDDLSQRVVSDITLANELYVAIQRGVNWMSAFSDDFNESEIWSVMHSDDFRYAWLKDFRPKST